jgi:hypothetical protein
MLKVFLLCLGLLVSSHTFSQVPPHFLVGFKYEVEKSRVDTYFVHSFVIKDSADCIRFNRDFKRMRFLMRSRDGEILFTERSTKDWIVLRSSTVGLFGRAIYGFTIYPR